MKKVLLFILLFICVFSLGFSTNLIWWFKVNGENKWLSIAIPFLLYNFSEGENYLLGLNFPDSSDEDVKISENVSFGYVLKRGMELKVNNVYTGRITESSHGIELKIKEFNLKNLKMNKYIFSQANVGSLLNSFVRFLKKDFSRNLKKDELKVMAEAIRKYNSERMKAIEEGLSKFPSSIFLREIYLKELIEEEDYEKIIDFLDTPKTMGEYRIKIYSLIKVGDFPEAEKLLELIKNKTACDFNNYAILIILSNGNRAAARENFMRAESFSPRDWRIYYNYSLFEFMESNNKKAKEEIVKSVKTSFRLPVQIELFKRIVNMSSEISGFGLTTKKEVLLKNILDSISFFSPDENPEFMPILNEEIPVKKDVYYFNEGINSLSSGDYYMSKKLLKRYLFQDPLNDKVFYTLALANYYLGDYKSALVNVETALLLKHRLLYELLRLEIFYRLTEISKFNSLYKRLKELYPANSDIDKIYNHEDFRFPLAK